MVYLCRPFANEACFIYSFVLNNKGYTVERYFHGMQAKYNEVPSWDYRAIFQALAPEVDVKSFRIETGEQLDSLLSDEAFKNASIPQVRFQLTNNVQECQFDIVKYYVVRLLTLLCFFGLIGR